MPLENLLLCCCVCVIHVKKTLTKNDSKISEHVHGAVILCIAFADSSSFIACILCGLS